MTQQKKSLQELVDSGIDPIIRFESKSTRKSNSPTVEDILGKHRATIYRDVDKGFIDPPLEIGPKARGYPLSKLLEARRRMEAGTYYKTTSEQQKAKEKTTEHAA